MGTFGGRQPGAGRKPKIDEEKANTIFLNALKKIYSVDTDDEAKEAFVAGTLMDSQRGQLFIAEHLFGKPKEVVDNNVTLNNFSLKDVLAFKSNDNTK